MNRLTIWYPVSCGRGRLAGAAAADPANMTRLPTPMAAVTTIAFLMCSPP